LKIISFIFPKSPSLPQAYLTKKVGAGILSTCPELLTTSIVVEGASKTVP